MRLFQPHLLACAAAHWPNVGRYPTCYTPPDVYNQAIMGRVREQVWRGERWGWIRMPWSRAGYSTPATKDPACG